MGISRSFPARHMDGATMRGAKSVDGKPPPKRKAIVDCFPEALRCHRGRNPRNGIDTEACVMLCVEFNHWFGGS